MELYKSGMGGLYLRVSSSWASASVLLFVSTNEDDSRFLPRSLRSYFLNDVLKRPLKKTVDRLGGTPVEPF